MEKEKVLEIEIKKINDEYSVFYPTKLNIKELEKAGYTVTEFDVLDEVKKTAINFYFNNKNDFTILLNDSSLNVPFIIENIYIEELKKIVDEYNKKYGIPKRWRAEDFRKYYYINSVSDICASAEEKQNLDNERYELGNYFKTEEEAQKVIDSKEWQEFWEKVRAGEIGG
jgi:hypothetical protein